MLLDRMELADFVTPIKLAQGILKQLPGLKPPVPIEEIALALDITEIRELETKGFEGGLLAFSDKASGVILVNQRSSRQRRRFTIGHELGHFLNPWHEPQSSGGFQCSSRDFLASDVRTSNKAIRMEAEANQFSASLLMPASLLKMDIRAVNELGIAQIWELANTYDVSKEALARRYVELCDEPCMVLLSKNGKFLYSYRHPDFPFINLREGSSLPKASLSTISQLAEGEIADWSESDPCLWTNSDKLVAVYEQTVLQREGFRMTLLHGELRDEEDDAEEKELSRSWTPRFHK